MVWSPKVTVAAIVEVEGRFLCVEEQDRGRRVINQPAGHLEPGESLIEAVRREVREETGCEFAPQGLVGVYLWPLDETATYLRFCFSGNVATQHAEGPSDPDIIAVHWFDIATLRAQRERLRNPLVLRCIEDARQRPHCDLEMLHAVDL